MNPGPLFWVVEAEGETGYDARHRERFVHNRRLLSGKSNWSSRIALNHGLTMAEPNGDEVPAHFSLMEVFQRTRH